MKKIIQKILLLVATSLCLFSCGESSEYIEYKTNKANNCMTSKWNCFGSRMKVRKKAQEAQDVEVYFGFDDSYFPIYLNEKNVVVDRDQMLELKLYRKVYTTNQGKSYIYKTVEVYSTTQKLEYFFSDDFYYENNMYIDQIAIDEDLAVYDDYGLIEYQFEIFPTDSEEILLYENGKSIYQEYIKGLADMDARYKVKEDKIQFYSWPKKKEETINYQMIGWVLLGLLILAGVYGVGKSEIVKINKSSGVK